MNIFDILQQSKKIKCFDSIIDGDITEVFRSAKENDEKSIMISMGMDGALEYLSEMIKQSVPFCIGVGNVVNLDQCKNAIEHGAKFVITAGFDADIINYCREHNVDIIPGCSTATDIIRCEQMEIFIVYYYSAEYGNESDALEALSHAFNNVSFLISGNLAKEKLQKYLEQPYVAGYIL